jgi:hypothetical protein
MTSSDGTAWTPHAGEENAWFSVTFGNNLFVAVANSSTSDPRVMTSSDGTNWTARASAEDNAWFSVTFGNNLFVAVSNDGTNRVMTSSNGTTWTARAAAEANTWWSVTFGNDLFVAVSSTGTNRVMTSGTFLTAPAFTLSSSVQSVTANAAITTVTSISTGGAIASYAISPPAPAGLTFSTINGQLSGTPTSVQSATTYTITATNAVDTATQTFALTVSAAPAPKNNADQEAGASRQAQEQREILDLLSIIPSIASLSTLFGTLAVAASKQKCVKGKAIKYVKRGAKCPTGFVKK